MTESTTRIGLIDGLHYAYIISQMQSIQLKVDRFLVMLTSNNFIIGHILFIDFHDTYDGYLNTKGPKAEPSNRDIHSTDNVDSLVRWPKASRTMKLALIGSAGLAITLLASFSTSLLMDKAKLADQLAAAEDDYNKSLEKTVFTNFLELSDGESKNLRVLITNNGPVISTYKYFLLYCLSESCASGQGVPVVNPNSVIPTPPIAMAPGDTREIEVGPLTDGLTYRVELISERGNVISTTQCTADLTKLICGSPGEVTINK